MQAGTLHEEPTLPPALQTNLMAEMCWSGLKGSTLL